MHYFCKMQIKKCTSLLLAMLLLVSNIGLAFNVHYCGGSVADISSVYNFEEVCEIAEGETKRCCDEKLETKKPCCEDKTVEFQDDSDEIIVKTFSIGLTSTFVIPPTLPIEFFSADTVNRADALFSYSYQSNSPPLFKLYSSYLLYA